MTCSHPDSPTSHFRSGCASTSPRRCRFRTCSSRLFPIPSTAADERRVAGRAAAYNLGGIFGAVICAFVISRMGSRWALTIFSACGAAVAFSLTTVNVMRNTDLLIWGLGLHGLFVIAVQAAMYAVCAHVYPTTIRATGTASALSFGRFGAILSAYAGAMMITMGSGTAYRNMLGVSMILVMAALLLVRRHIPALSARKTAPSVLPTQPNSN